METNPLDIASTDWIIPEYCVNQVFHSLLIKRFPQISGDIILAELHQLQSSATEYFRAYDLLAYKYYVLENNPYRRNSCENVKYEYIPFLPFYWRPNILSKYTNEEKYKKQSSSSFPPPITTNLSAAVEDIVLFMETDRNIYETTRFTVISAFNFRTLLGSGMPTPHRKGYVYNTVTNWVLSLSIGHYERYPQCPDLLRRSWKYIIELPYVSMNTLNRLNSINHKNSISTYKLKTIDIFYSGRFDLIGPEIVCSIRNSITLLASLPKTMIVNITYTETESSIVMKVFHFMQISRFCIVTKADSYSSSALYHAIQAECIPIVISDWFVFSFPWLIPYEQFIIRVAEKDFVKNPISVMQTISKKYPDQIQQTMIEAMRKWSRLLSYDPIVTNTDEYHEIQQMIHSQQYHILSSHTGDKKLSKAAVGARLHAMDTVSTTHHSILPFDLLLLELHMKNKNKTKVLPCISPFECTPLGESIYKYAVSFGKNELIDIRSHLCQHNSRLIGHYKLVYFMQCVRVLWPLQPGRLKPSDRPSIDSKSSTSGDNNMIINSNNKGLTTADYNLIMNFHNLTAEAKSKKWFYPVIYPPIDMNLQSRIYPLKELRTTV